MSTGGATGGASTAGEEELEDDAEMEDDSTSNVSMLATGGSFITGTADGTVSEARYSSKRHRTAENMSEDLLNRRIQDYGLVSPERAKHLVWYFFKKYGTKQLNRQDDNLNLAQQALCTICLADQDRRRHSTVKLGKDKSPTSMMDHLRNHHREEFDAVVVANTRGLSLVVFNTQRKEPHVRALLGNSSQRESTDNSPATIDSTPNAGNAAGVALDEGSMVRLSVTQVLFQKPDTQEDGGLGQQRSMTDVFKPLSSWTEKQDRQWKEDLVCCVAEQYLPLTIVDALATPATSCPVERLFSVEGQVDASRRANLSSDNLTLLVFMHEALPLLRKIRALKILQESLSVL